jgi:hypothetical protein
MCALVSVSALASAGSPPITEAWQRVEYAVIVEDEGAQPYVEFVTEKDTFFGYENDMDEMCRGGTIEDLGRVWDNDPDDLARIRFVPGNEEICPNGTYVCIDPNQDGTSDEPDGIGFCGSLRLERPENE